ncbi:type 2 lanthipeptide synthetase LanM [Azorhizobium doebereinerae]|uniref:type 2 lanthipeptide synthetase LanM n=1 Tax=Azorhizobium doebereinerae TaxID=281091 RepID=UPI0003FB53D0|nr:type 2 lanthipeptide synthetase LanM [Azorhizobium doebereinerae]
MPSTTAPFLDLLSPLLEPAAPRLRAALTGIAVAPGVHGALHAALGARLSEVAAPALVEAFRADAPLPAVARLFDAAPDGVPRERYAAFVAAFVAALGNAGLDAWPVLRDRLATLCADRERNLASFARHLAQDGPSLCARHPAWGGSVPEITDLALGLSDPHAGGRSVIRVTFADGTRLAYKPRALAAEAAFGALLGTLADDDRAPRQYAPWVLDQGDHGWMEWVAPAPLGDMDAARAYMARCGGLLALLGLLRGGDIHPDNLVPAGAFPVIVDLECLFQPSPADLGLPDPLDDPLLFSNGLLPVFTAFDGGASLVAIAAAGAGPVPLRPETHVAHAGTDWLHLADRLVPSFAEGPRLGEAVLDVRDFAGEVAHGFQATLAALLRRRADLTAPDGALARFRDVPCRLLCAPTNLYALLAASALSGDGARAEAAFTRRAARAAGRPPLIADARAWAAVLAAEAVALARLDIPAFTFTPGRREAASVEGAGLGPVFAIPMYDRVAADFAALDAATIADRAALVRAALRRPPPAQARAEAAPAAPEPRAVLRGIADRIAGLAVPQGTEGATWVRLWEQIPALVAPAGPGLCYGATGTAVFLAEAGRALEDEHMLGLCRKALHPLRAAVRRGESARLAARFGPGYGRGLGGMVAAFAWCAGLLDDPALAQDALALAKAADAALAAAPGAADVMDGAAGLALGLAALARQCPEDPCIAAALSACGAAILAASRPAAPGLRHWPDRRRPGLPGLSHGAAGMAAALVHIHTLTGQSEALAAAREALAYEDTLFDPQARNWPSGGGSGHHLSSWCHGAPGIALARTAIGAALGEDAGLGDSARIALETARITPVNEVDDLCCGEAGRLEVLSVIAGRGEPGLQTDIDAALAARLPDWAAGRARMLAAGAPGAPEDAALFRGWAGIGHVLVRRLAPECACDVLLPWPAPR